VEPRIFRVWNTAAIAEAFDQLVLNACEHRDEFHRSREVIDAAARQERGMLGRKLIGLRLGRICDDLARHHRPEPFANVAFVEPCGIGDLLRGRCRQSRHRFKKPDAVADAQAQCDGRFVQCIDKSLGKCFRFLLVKIAV